MTAIFQRNRWNIATALVTTVWWPLLQSNTASGDPEVLWCRGDPIAPKILQRTPVGHMPNRVWKYYAAAFELCAAVLFSRMVRMQAGVELRGRFLAFFRFSRNSPLPGCCRRRTQSINHKTQLARNR